MVALFQSVSPAAISAPLGIGFSESLLRFCVASKAATRPVSSDTSVQKVELVPINTMGLSRVFGDDGIAEQNVVVSGHRLQVVRVCATAIVALVMNIVTRRDCSLGQLIRNPMSQFGSTSIGLCMPVSSWIDTANPGPAIARAFLVNVAPKPFFRGFPGSRFHTVCSPLECKNPAWRVT
jgi:hypothetical protein